MRALDAKALSKAFRAFYTMPEEVPAPYGDPGDWCRRTVYIEQASPHAVRMASSYGEERSAVADAIRAYLAATQDNEEMTMGDEHKIRWSGFSDQELTDLVDGMAARCNYSTDRASEERADALTEELRKEIDRRSRSYRGPGIYENSRGELSEALGTVYSPGQPFLQDNMMVVMRELDSTSGMLGLVPKAHFGAESRYWTYVGPAGEGS